MRIKYGKVEYTATKKPLVFIFDNMDKIEIRYSKYNDIFIAFPKGYDLTKIAKLMSAVQKEVKNAKS